MKSDFERLLMSAGAAGSEFNLEQFVRRKGDLIEMDSDVLLSFGMAQVRLLPIRAFGSILDAPLCMPHELSSCRFAFGDLRLVMQKPFSHVRSPHPWIQPQSP